MVDAHGEVHIESEGKSQDSFSSDLLKGQGRAMDRTQGRVGIATRAGISRK